MSAFLGVIMSRALPWPPSMLSPCQPSALTLSSWSEDWPPWPAQGVLCWARTGPGAEEISACQELTVWLGRCPVPRERWATESRPRLRRAGAGRTKRKSFLSTMTDLALGKKLGPQQDCHRTLLENEGQRVGLRVCRNIPRCCEVSSQEHWV